MSIVIQRAGKIDDVNTNLDIARGLVPGLESKFVFGFNPSANIAAEETIWDQGGLYTYLTADTELFISSSDASDTNIILDIEGMTDDFVVRNIQVTFTSGQSQQSIGSFFRFFQAEVVGGSAPAGDLYFAQTDTLSSGVPDTDSKIKAKLLPGVNITRNAILTVPADHSLYLTIMISHTRKNKSAIMKPMFRSENAPAFVEITQFPSFEGSVVFPFNPQFKVDAKTDIELRVNTDSNGTESVGKFEYILIDETV